MKLFTLGMCVAVLVLTMLAQPLIHILATDRYSGAVIVVFPLVMGLAIQATSWITEIGIGISKRSYLSLYSQLAAIASTLVGIWFFAPIFGLFGVGLGVLLGYFVNALIVSWLAQYAHQLPWQYKPVILLMTTTLVLGLAATWLGQQFGAVASNLLLVASLLIVLLMSWGLLLDKLEQERVRNALRSRVFLHFTHL